MWQLFCLQEFQRVPSEPKCRNGSGLRWVQGEVPCAG